MKVADVGTWAEAVLSQVERAVVGKRPALNMILMSVLARGHVLIEDYPGLAKTLAARSFATALGCTFKRIQFTPDLLPGDILGTYVFDQLTGHFHLRPGPIFTQVLLADEINRATPRTQSGLLEAMQEEQVTLEGTTMPLPRPFVVLATQNPIEHEGTFPLPEAQLDRFLVRIRFGYPTRPDEMEILSRRIARRGPSHLITAVTSPEEVLAMQEEVEKVHVDPDLIEYMVLLVEKTRDHTAVELGSSPRGTLALLGLSRARAALDGRDFVVPDDVKAVAVAALAHRVIIKPAMWYRNIRAEEVVQAALEQVPVPKGERWRVSAR